MEGLEAMDATLGDGKQTFPGSFCIVCTNLELRVPCTGR